MCRVPVECEHKDGWYTQKTDERRYTTNKTKKYDKPGLRFKEYIYLPENHDYIQSFTQPCTLKSLYVYEFCSFV